MNNNRNWLVAAAPLVALIVFACVGLRLAERPARAQAQGAAGPAKSSAALAENERLMSIGKKLFLGRCASCHNERGDKPLDSGLPLNERKLTDEVITRNVTGRFAKATDEEKRAVGLYIRGFLKNRD